jgi:hypothetical protein
VTVGLVAAPVDMPVAAVAARLAQPAFLGVPTSHAAKVLASGPIVARVHSLCEVLVRLPVDCRKEQGIDSSRSVGFADVKFLNELVSVA